jgi:YidC/Oxa1 family membrane protein insertase
LFILTLYDFKKVIFVNIKEYIIPIFFSVAMTAIIQRYFFNKQINQLTNNGVQLTQCDVTKPLEFDLHFDEYNPDIVEERSLISTLWGDIQFSSEGGSIWHIQTKQGRGLSVVVKTFDSINKGRIELHNLLVGFDNGVLAPYQFKLVNLERTDDFYRITYLGENKNVRIVKEFEVKMDRPIIALSLTVVPLRKDFIIPCIRMYGPPYNAESSHALMVNSHNEFKKELASELSKKNFCMATMPKLVGIDNRYFINSLFKCDPAYLNRIYFHMVDKEVALTMELSPVDQEAHFDFSFYMGPKDLEMLRSADPRLEQSLDYHGWFAILSKFLLKVLKTLYDYCGNYGIAIIILTFLMKLLLLPFAINSEKNMQQQKELQKKMAHLQAKHKNNPEQLKYEQAMLIKKYGLPSLGGCLPMILQIPFFFALSRLLSYAIELYKAPFFWISDLSAPDPWYILPLLVFISMLITAIQADEKQQIALIAMAILFGGITASLASGLALYFIANAVSNVVQSRIIKWWSDRHPAAC